MLKQKRDSLKDLNEHDCKGVRKSRGQLDLFAPQNGGAKTARQCGLDANQVVARTNGLTDRSCSIYVDLGIIELNEILSPRRIAFFYKFEKNSMDLFSQ